MGVEVDMPENRDSVSRQVPRPIEEIADRAGIPRECLEKYGESKAKVIWPQPVRDLPIKGKLIMVTAMTPTPAGVGKTTTAIGLADAFGRLGKRSMVALREPSLGPVFGMKGGATGGGLARVIPSDDINLHFTGDLHAVTSAHNLLAAMVDNRLHFEGVCGLIDLRTIAWKRVLDMNDRVLRDVVLGIGGPLRGIARESGFDITAASEVLAILCLSADMKELKQRLGRIVIGYGIDRLPVRAAQIKAEGAMAALLKDAMKPNLVQTLEGTPALIHGGPFANIAHGTNSVIATRLGLSLADYVVTESGFASDLGAEKFFDIVVRTGHVPPPDACVLAATLRALKLHGGVNLKDVAAENPTPWRRVSTTSESTWRTSGSSGSRSSWPSTGFPRIRTMEIRKFFELCRADGTRAALSDVYGQGGAGGVELARALMRVRRERAAPIFSFCILWICRSSRRSRPSPGRYTARPASPWRERRGASSSSWRPTGSAGCPVCIAKTQYSLSDDNQALGRPSGFTLIVTDVSVSAGAGFVVVYCGDIMTMPGLPSTPAAEHVDVTDTGEITGLS